MKEGQHQQLQDAAHTANLDTELTKKELRVNKLVASSRKQPGCLLCRVDDHHQQAEKALCRSLCRSRSLCLSHQKQGPSILQGYRGLYQIICQYRE